MNRLELLRNYLITGTVPTDSKYADWVVNHQPLLSPDTFSEKGRRLNRFCVGSDPEFCFEHTSDPGRRATAAELGLYVGLAAGADQNERLVELRPWPSHSVVEHVAGMLTALRWLYRVYSNACHYSWRAGAFFGGDGLGGHVHFGRKRPTRKEEIQALDGLAFVMRQTGLFPAREWAQRQKGDRFHNAPYGNYSDFRVQAHGYEYRTMPSWLHSPKTAFIVVCLSKLAVFDPAVTADWKRIKDPVLSRNLLRGLAKLYKGRDDDAYILYHVLTGNGDAPFVINHEMDFKGAWGIPNTHTSSTEIANDGRLILPGCIKPTKDEVKAVFDHLLHDVPLPYARTPKTFRGEIPSGYIWLPTVIAPARRSGFGDFVHNLVNHKESQIEWTYGAHDEFYVRGEIPARWSGEETTQAKEHFPQLVIEKGNWKPGGSSNIVIPRNLCQPGTIGGLRAFILYSGLFPVWTVDTVQTDSYPKWLHEHEKAKPLSWRVV